jgi:hypothetical protein
MEACRKKKTTRATVPQLSMGVSIDELWIGKTIFYQGSPHLVKTGLHEFYLS